jgi:hypothetical protein
MLRLSIVVLIAERAVNARDGGLQTHLITQGPAGVLEVTSFLLSITVNLASTVLIAIKAWYNVGLQISLEQRLTYTLQEVPTSCQGTKISRQDHGPFDRIGLPLLGFLGQYPNNSSARSLNFVFFEGPPHSFVF